MAPKFFSRWRFGSRAAEELLIRVQTLERQLAEAQAQPRGLFSAFRTDLRVEPAGRTLKHEELREAYRLAYPLRRAVDIVAHQVSQLKFKIEPPGKDDRQKEAFRWLFQKENSAEESFRDILYKTVVDILVIHKGAIEIARAPSRKFTQLFARDAATFKQQVDKHGIVEQFVQDPAEAGTQHGTGVSSERIEFESQGVIYIDGFAKSYLEVSEPIIESVANEIAFILKSSERAAHFATPGTLPDGFLHLSQLSKDAYERASESFKTGEKSGLRVVDGVDKAEWVEIAKPFIEEANELRVLMEQAIYRAYGLVPVNIEPTGQSPEYIGSQLRQSELVRPIAMILQSQINTKLADVLEESEFKFVAFPTASPKELTGLVRGAVLTPNEARSCLGIDPIEGGDELILTSPTGTTTAKDLISQKNKVPGQENPPTASSNNSDTDDDSMTEEDDEENSSAPRALALPSKPPDKISRQEPVPGVKTTKTPEEVLAVKSDRDYVDRRFTLMKRMQRDLLQAYRSYSSQVSDDVKNQPQLAADRERQARTKLFTKHDAIYDKYIPRAIQLGIQKAKRQLGEEFFLFVSTLNPIELERAVRREYVDAQQKIWKDYFKDRLDVPLSLVHVEQTTRSFQRQEADPLDLPEEIRKFFDENKVLADVGGKKYEKYIQAMLDEPLFPSDAILKQLEYIESQTELTAQTLKVPGEVPLLQAVNEINGLTPTFSLFWVSAKDETTCESCIRLAGAAYNVDQFDPRGDFPSPGQFLNREVGLICGIKCRCFLRPIVLDLTENAPWLDRNFTTRGLDKGSEFSVDNLKELFDVALDIPAEKLVKGLPGTFKQVGLWRGVSQVKVVSPAALKKLVTKDLKRLRGSGYLTKDGNLVLYIDDTLPLYRQKLDVAYGLSAYRRYRDNFLVGEFFREDMRIIGEQLRRQALEKNSALRKAFDEVERQAFLAGAYTDDMIATIQDVGRKGQLDWPWQVYIHTDDLHDMYMSLYLSDYNTFSRLPGARVFQDQLVSTSFDPTPTAKYMNRIWKGRKVPYPRNLSAKDIDVIEARLLENAFDEQDRIAIRGFMATVRNTPGLQRKEFFENLDVIFDTNKNPLSVFDLEGTADDISFSMTSLGKKSDLITAANLAGDASAQSIKQALGKDFTGAIFIPGKFGTDVVAVHELGHIIYHYSLSEASRRKFTGLWRAWLTDLRNELSNNITLTRARKAMTQTELELLDDVLATFDKLIKGEKGVLDRYAASFNSEVKTFQDQLERVQTLLQEKKVTTSWRFRPYVASTPDEFFADFFSRMTLTPVSAQYLYPEAAQFFEWFIKTDLLKVPISEVISDVSVREKVREFILNMKVSGPISEALLTDEGIDKAIKAFLEAIALMDTGKIPGEGGVGG